jgi:hypothetical protein
MERVKGDFKSIINDLLPNGGTRAVLLIGALKDTDYAKNNLSNSLVKGDPGCLWIEMDGVHNDSPETLMANFARSIKGGDAFDTKALGLFGRKTGQMLASQASQTLNRPTEIAESLKPLTRAQLLIKYLDELASDVLKAAHKPTPILCFHNLSSYSLDMIDWICNELNKAMRSSNICRNARFVFTDTKQSKKCDRFFNRFGFQRVKQVRVLPVHKKQNQEIISLTNTKELKKNMNSPKLSTSMQDQKQRSLNPKKELEFSSFSKKYQEYLLVACLPHFISRDTLEYFCPPTDAAYCYNWLLRTNNVVQSAHDNFLILNSSIKKSAREALLALDPKAEQKKVLASVLDKFMEYFPSPELHWVPVNLQLFSSFTIDLLKKIFDNDRFEIIDSFLIDHEEILSKDQKRLTLQEEPKLITKRLLELTNLEPIDGLSGKISAQWEQDQLLYESQKKSLESERLAMEQEIEEIKGQVSHFSQMRDQLIEDSSNPNAYRPKKNFTFSLSLPLVVIGLTAIGASLFSDSIGSYHAACGLFLTFIGFFWPSVELQKTAFQTAGGKPKLAIETQQRSFNHRISGLVNRASSLKESLTTVDGNLDSLNTGAHTPYLSS